MSELKKCYACETVYEDTTHICEPHKMSSGKALIQCGCDICMGGGCICELYKKSFPPRLMVLFYNDGNYRIQTTKILSGSKPYLSEEEHSAILQEKDKEIERLKIKITEMEKHAEHKR